MDGGASSLVNLSGMLIDDRDRSSFDKEFECSVCLEEMRPPTKIFQCRNGHVMCEACKNHTEVSTCPTCRYIPLLARFIYILHSCTFANMNNDNNIIYNHSIQ
jgi:hypothetical protein